MSDQAGQAGAAEAQKKHTGPSRGRAIRDSILEGNTFTVTVLAIFTAFVVAGC